MWQFLVESATLSVFGGVAGMAIGFAIAALVSAVSVLPYVVNAALVGIAFAVTIVLGLVFGTYPALRAARLDPVEALRSE
jgi:putative ABC transport system permease protein